MLTREIIPELRVSVKEVQRKVKGGGLHRPSIGLSKRRLRKRA